MPTAIIPVPNRANGSAPVMFGRTPFSGLISTSAISRTIEHPEQRQHVEGGERDEIVELVAEVVEVQFAPGPGQARHVLLGDPAESGDADEPQAEDHHAAGRGALAEVRREQLGEDADRRDGEDVGGRLREQPSGPGGDAGVAAETGAAVAVVEEEVDRACR